MQGLTALRAGGEVAKRATGEIQDDASNPDLQAALQAGNKTSEQWAQRIEQALQETGSAEEVGNPVLEALYEVSKKIRQKAPNAMSRDLGIIAAGQLALHYWIAAFGTLGNYAAKLARIIHEKCAIKAKPLISFTTMRMGCLMKFFAMKSLAQVFGGLGRFRAVR